MPFFVEDKVALFVHLVHDFVGGIVFLWSDVNTHFACTIGLLPETVPDLVVIIRRRGLIMLIQRHIFVVGESLMRRQPSIVHRNGLSRMTSAVLSAPYETCAHVGAFDIYGHGVDGGGDFICFQYFVKNECLFTIPVFSANPF